jgi:hypothetical protein
MDRVRLFASVYALAMIAAVAVFVSCTSDSGNGGDDDDSAAEGACCSSGQQCVVATERACADGGGVGWTKNADCDPNPCQAGDDSDDDSGDDSGDDTSDDDTGEQARWTYTFDSDPLNGLPGSPWDVQAADPSYFKILTRMNGTGHELFVSGGYEVYEWASAAYPWASSVVDTDFDFAFDVWVNRSSIDNVTLFTKLYQGDWNDPAYEAYIYFLVGAGGSTVYLYARDQTTDELCGTFTYGQWHRIRVEMRYNGSDPDNDPSTYKIQVDGEYTACGNLRWHIGDGNPITWFDFQDGPSAGNGGTGAFDQLAVYPPATK